MRCEQVTREARVAGNYSVYGDDIIVPTQCAEATIELLTSLGFKTNVSKSFYDKACWFRESCGGEYCDGYDVTPMRISRKFRYRPTINTIDEYVSLANESYRRNFRFLRQFFLRKLIDSGMKLHFSKEKVLSDNYTNYHTKRRFNPDLQREEIRVHVSRTQSHQRVS